MNPLDANERRSIDIRMDDKMRFTPSRLVLRQGETVRLRIRNAGAVMHELMPCMAHVEPHQRGEIVWTFNRAGEFEFACLIPGHFEAGMRGSITVKAQP